MPVLGSKVRTLSMRTSENHSLPSFHIGPSMKMKPVATFSILVPGAITPSSAGSIFLIEGAPCASAGAANRHTKGAKYFNMKVPPVIFVKLRSQEWCWATGS